MKHVTSKHIVMSSSYGSLHFTNSEEYEEFAKEEKALYKKYHDLEVKKHGIYASNQGKFVQSIDELNDLDSYPHPLDDQDQYNYIKTKTISDVSYKQFIGRAKRKKD